MLRWIFSMLFALVMSPSYAAEFRLTSPSIQEQGKMSNEQVFSGMGCSGKNISPELHWDNAPKETKSFAVTVYDPDAPTGSGWWHWVIFNIPATIHALPSNAGNPVAPFLREGRGLKLGRYQVDLASAHVAPFLREGRGLKPVCRNEPPALTT